MATKRDGIARAVVYVTTRVVNVDVLEDLEEKNAVSSYSIPSDHKILSSLIIIVICDSERVSLTPSTQRILKK